MHFGRHLGSRLLVTLLVSVTVMLVNVNRLPRVANPDVADGASSRVAVGHHLAGQSTPLRLVLVL